MSPTKITLSNAWKFHNATSQCGKSLGTSNSEKSDYQNKLKTRGSKICIMFMIKCQILRSTMRHYLLLYQHKKSFLFRCCYVEHLISRHYHIKLVLVHNTSSFKIDIPFFWAGRSGSKGRVQEVTSSMWHFTSNVGAIEDAA